MDNCNKSPVVDNDYEHLALGALLDLDSEIHCSGINPSKKKLDCYAELVTQENGRNDDIKGKSANWGLAINKKNVDFQKKMESAINERLVPSNHFKSDSHFTDPVFGLRIVDPLISSLLLKERMSTRKNVTFNELSLNGSRDMPHEWVIAGVILSKDIKSNSKNGRPFTIWKLSDMRGDIKTLSLLLFQNAHDELWKTALGTCVAVLNPCVIDKQNLEDIACLSINSAKKVLLLGASKDMGVCKAQKKNGERCKKFININECDFCIYHVEKEFKKIVRPVTIQKLKRQDNRSLDKSICLPTYNTSKLLQRDKLLMNNLQTSTEIRSVTNNTQSPKGFRPGVASNCEAETNQRIKDLQRLKSLRSKMDTATTTTESSLTSCAGISNTFFNLGNASTKEKAIDIVKKSPIEKIDPNSTRGSRAGKRRAVDNLYLDNSPKRQKNEEKLSIQKVLGTVSAHKDLIEFRQKEEEDKYFTKLEKKEAMENKMLNTFQIPCKAVICNSCKYAAFSAADRCKEERHTIKIIDAVKRFFQCKDCGNRTTTLFKLPKLSCSKCKSSRWERCGMVRDRTNQNLTEELSVRGDEEKFLGATCKSNINLLVPL